MRRPYLLIGACLRAHGVMGEVLVKSLTEDNDRFYRGLTCYAMDGDQPVRELALTGCRVTPKGLLLAFEGMESREKAQSLAGLGLAVKREDALELGDEFEFYYGDLVGADVVDARRGHLGTVADITSAGGAEILLVTRQGANDLLIPFLRSMVRTVDTDRSRIDVDLPDDLFDLYR